MYTSKMANAQTDRLVDALLCLKDREEGYRFLEDLMTFREIGDLAQRLEVARMLVDRVTYAEITQQTGVSSATIGRVNRSLHYGADGYQLVLGRLGIRSDDHD